MKKYLSFLLLLATLVLFVGCQSTPIDKPNAEISNVTDGVDTTDQSSVNHTVEGFEPYKETFDKKETQSDNQNQTFQKAELNADEISSVTIKILTSLDVGPRQKIITDKALIGEMVQYWNNVELKNKVERSKPGTTLIVMFNSNIVFSINDGYLVYDGNYYEQPFKLEEQFKKYYGLAKEKETSVEF